jgi:Methyltransferase domain
VSSRVPFGVRVDRFLRIPRIEHIGAALVEHCAKGSTVIDLGCGEHSPVRNFTRGLRLVGVDAHQPSLDEAARQRTHDDFVLADILDDLDAVRLATAGENVQLLTMLHVIEHLPKRLGYELLERAESLTHRFILIETPNGFLPQGPEYGNPAQRHLSGWFAHDFMGLGYEVRGTAGTRLLRGYAGRPVISARGGQSLDFALARLLMIDRYPRFSYSLAAWKDVRGIEARLG